jgi:hypothetical protein
MEIGFYMKKIFLKIKICVEAVLLIGPCFFSGWNLYSFAAYFISRFTAPLSHGRAKLPLVERTSTRYSEQN